MKKIYKEVKMIDCQDWSNLVSETYGRHYVFQQQDGCKGRGIHKFTIPEDYDNDSYMNDEIPEIVNHGTMGVKFEKWLERDPKQLLTTTNYEHSLSLWWERNFYPDFQTVANDLYKKGKIEKGDYIIEIDW